MTRESLVFFVFKKNIREGGYMNVGGLIYEDLQTPTQSHDQWNQSLIEISLYRDSM